MAPRVTTLVIATRNRHKVDEIRSVLGGGLRYLTMEALGTVPEITESGTTFAENARLKSQAVATWLRQPHSASASAARTVAAADWAVLADDSGLEVEALGGAPGVQSARFAAKDFRIRGNAPDGANNAKLLRMLADVPADQRVARFRCALALTRCSHPANTHGFEGVCEGRIGYLPRGSGGFGYDPLFTPQGYNSTFAELGEAVKNRISHRARALAALRQWLDAQPR
jgi:XTP/dITP diphosphohydrolase